MLARHLMSADNRHQHHHILCCEWDMYHFQRFVQSSLKYKIQTLLFERLQISDTKSRIIAACNATEYFLASFVAIILIDSVGRRKLMFFGSAGQTITMILLAVLGSINNSAARIISAVLLFVFNSFFAVGWLGMTWLYVSLQDTGY
jgi:sugar phosphate permease